MKSLTPDDKAIDDVFGEPISIYTTQQAVEDGVLVDLGMCGDTPVYATSNCYRKAGLDNPINLRGVVMEAIEMLDKPDPEDDGNRKLRVMHKGKAVDYECLWVIHDGQGITFMFPEDY